MSAEVWTLLAAVLGGGLMTALANNLFQRRKIQAEADMTASGAWKDLVQPYRDEVQSLRGEMAELRAEIVTLARENSTLQAELRSAKQQIGVLSRLERESTIKTAERTAAVTTALAGAGIEVPEVKPAAPAPLSRTRATDDPDEGAP